MELKLECGICGKKREVVNQPKDLRGKNVNEQNVKWISVRDKENQSLHILLCTGGLKGDEDRDKCLNEYLKDKDLNFINSIVIEDFLPLKRLTPKDCIS